MRKYLLVFLCIFIMCLLGLLSVLFYLSPEDFPVMATGLFYLFFFLLSFSLFTVLGYLLRRMFQFKVNKFFHFQMSLRQAILLSMFSCLSAYLLNIQAFTWWSVLSVLAFLFFIEIFFMVRDHKE